VTDGSRAAANRKARDERKTAHLRAIQDRHAAVFRAVHGSNPLGVARDVHAAIDAVLDQDRRKDPDSAGIRCRKGCSHCCHEPVEIWPQEAAALVEAARTVGVELDRARIERQSRHTIESWRQQTHGERACVFLGEDGACRVYEFRPNACRKLLVVTDPELCNGENRAPDSVGRWFSWEAEIMESAALEVFGRGLMPAMLLAALGTP